MHAVLRLEDTQPMTALNPEPPAPTTTTSNSNFIISYDHLTNEVYKLIITIINIVIKHEFFKIKINFFYFFCGEHSRQQWS